MSKQKRRKNLPDTPEAADWRYWYKGEVLGQVVTAAEVTEIWDVSRATLDRAWVAGELEARKTLTGGAILYTVRSIEAKWGKPKKEYLPLLRENPDQISLFDLDELVKKTENSQWQHLK